MVWSTNFVLNEPYMKKITLISTLCFVQVSSCMAQSNKDLDCRLLAKFMKDPKVLQLCGLSMTKDTITVIDSSKVFKNCASFQSSNHYCIISTDMQNFDTNSRHR